MKRIINLPRELETKDLETSNIENSIFSEVIEGVKIIKKIGEELFKIIDQLISRPVSLDELASCYSPATDKIIIEGQKAGLKFIGGKFMITEKDVQNISVSLEAYFQDKNERWIKKSNQSLIPSNKLNEPALKELLNKHTIAYELQEPYL